MIGIGSCNYSAPSFSYVRKGDQPSRHVVLILGAGASVSAGCPLVRGFMDRAMDILAIGPADQRERAVLRRVLKLYDRLRSESLVTDEDFDNIENLLSLQLVENMVKSGEADDEDDLPAQDVAKFIELIISRNTRLPKPDSTEWIFPASSVKIYVDSIRQIARSLDQFTVITLNYDCSLEYCCHCLGVPFTYSADDSKLQIVKLHGSVNWLQCIDSKCVQFRKRVIAPVAYAKSLRGRKRDYVEAEKLSCPKCRSALSPVIIPPTFQKSYAPEPEMNVFKQAKNALAKAESIVAVGYSLPEADVAVRHLLNIGLAQSRLREAVVIVGQDEAAATRWRSVFRESWRRNRLTLLERSMEETLPGVLAGLMHLNVGDVGPQIKIPPLPVTDEDLDARFEAGELYAQASGADPQRVWEYGSLLAEIDDWRKGNRGAKSDQLEQFGFTWVPSGPCLPAEAKETANKA